MVKYAKKKPNQHNQVALWDSDSFCLPALWQLFRAGTYLLNGPQCASFPLQAYLVQNRKVFRCHLSPTSHFVAKDYSSKKRDFFKAIQPQRKAMPKKAQTTAQLHSSHREGSGNLLQYSCLENSMDGGAWQAAVHGVAKSWTRLSNFPFTFHFHALEKEMATHSTVLAWRIPGMGEPGGLPPMWLHRVEHD